MTLADELEALAAKATERPWCRAHTDDRNFANVVGIAKGGAAPQHDGGQLKDREDVLALTLHQACQWHTPDNNWTENADFIVFLANNADRIVALLRAGERMADAIEPLVWSAYDECSGDSNDGNLCIDCRNQQAGGTHGERWTDENGTVHENRCPLGDAIAEYREAEKVKA